MDKLLSIAVPSYNSEDYLAHCLDTLATGGPELEVIIVNDGSKDRTSEIAADYVKRYPDIFVLIDKENGGHGSGVNSGLDRASGRYFRVVDSDDWVGEEALQFMLDYIRALPSAADSPDMIITNYIYEYTYNNTTRRIRYNNVFREERILHQWKDIKRFRVDQFFAMHSLTYRTEILRDCGLRLPEHCFYVDNIYDYIPLPKVKQFVWLDIDLYHYFIGRNDQSVHTPVMIKRIDQQLLVTRTMIDAYHLEEDVKDPYKRRYMYRWLSTIIMISQIHLTLANTPEALRKIDDMWMYLKHHDKVMYGKIRRSFVNIMTSLPGPMGRWIDSKGFYFAQRVFKFS